MARECRFCSGISDFYCISCNTFVCFDHLFLEKWGWNAPCKEPKLGHAFVPLIQKGMGYRAVKATTIEGAKKEGKQLAGFFLSMFQKQIDVEFETVSAFAFYFAYDVLGYKDGEIANAWTQGFIARFMKTPTTEELSDKYSQGMITLQDFENMIRKALSAPVDRTREAE